MIDEQKVAEAINLALTDLGYTAKYNFALTLKEALTTVFPTYLWTYHYDRINPFRVERIEGMDKRPTWDEYEHHIRTQKDT